MKIAPSETPQLSGIIYSISFLCFPVFLDGLIGWFNLFSYFLKGILTSKPKFLRKELNGFIK